MRHRGRLSNLSTVTANKQQVWNLNPRHLAPGYSVHALIHGNSINSEVDLRLQLKFPIMKKEQKTDEKLVLKPQGKG